MIQDPQNVAHGPNLSPGPIYVIGVDPSPAPGIEGAFVVGRTPYLPYVFWSIET